LQDLLKRIGGRESEERLFEKVKGQDFGWSGQKSSLEKFEFAMQEDFCVSALLRLER
jgi:hypothetical protein